MNPANIEIGAAGDRGGPRSQEPSPPEIPDVPEPLPQGPPEEMPGTPAPQEAPVTPEPLPPAEPEEVPE